MKYLAVYTSLNSLFSTGSYFRSEHVFILYSTFNSLKYFFIFLLFIDWIDQQFDLVYETENTKPNVIEFLKMEGNSGKINVGPLELWSFVYLPSFSFLSLFTTFCSWAAKLVLKISLAGDDRKWWIESGMLFPLSVSLLRSLTNIFLVMCSACTSLFYLIVRVSIWNLWYIPRRERKD